MYLNKFFPILRNLGGYTEDRQTGREGLTLAGLMMFDKGLALFTLRLSQTGTWFICLFLFKLLLVFVGSFLPFTVLLT